MPFDRFMARSIATSEWSRKGFPACFCRLLFQRAEKIGKLKPPPNAC
jgi:hypothetical protein